MFRKTFRNIFFRRQNSSLYAFSIMNTVCYLFLLIYNFIALSFYFVALCFNFFFLLLELCIQIYQLIVLPLYFFFLFNNLCRAFFNNLFEPLFFFKKPVRIDFYNSIHHDKCKNNINKKSPPGSVPRWKNDEFIGNFRTNYSINIFGSYMENISTGV